MTLSTEEFFTFNGGRWRPLLQNSFEKSPIPMAAANGAWLHIPYGGNLYETDGGNLQTTYSLTIWIPAVVDGVPSNDYTLIKAKYLRFGSLTTPFGSQNARLATLNVHYVYRDQTWVGEATWEWA
jgi:hypothetical protein